MLRASIILFVLALVAALFGFGGIATSVATVAKWLFVGFMVLAVVALIAGRRVAT